MSELVTTIAKIEVAPKQKYLVLEVMYCGGMGASVWDSERNGCLGSGFRVEG